MDNHVALNGKIIGKFCVSCNNPTMAQSLIAYASSQNSFVLTAKQCTYLIKAFNGMKMKGIFDVWEYIKKNNVELDLKCYATLFNSCKQLADARLAEEVLLISSPSKVFILSFFLSSFYHSFIVIHCACLLIHVIGQIRSHVQRSSYKNDTFLCSQMIMLYAKLGNPQEAIHLWELMMGNGVHLDDKSLISIIIAIRQSKCNSNLESKISEQLVKKPRNFGIKVHNALIAMYMSQDDDSRALSHAEVLMQNKISLDINSYTFILKACAETASLELGKRVHALIESSHQEMSAIAYGSLINMYAKCGCLREATEVSSSSFLVDFVLFVLCIFIYLLLSDI
jgi:pentatricopeptide repeat protein